MWQTKKMTKFRIIFFVVVLKIRIVAYWSDSVKRIYISDIFIHRGKLTFNQTFNSRL